ncbi:hypothetical protein ACLB2K_008723 [Fragaria x ananassa]
MISKESEKFEKLKKLLDEVLGDHKNAIVFANTKKNVNSLAKNLSKNGYHHVITLHSDLSQPQRDSNLEGKSGLATTFLTMQDIGVFYDLKKMLIQSNSLVPPELARHEASKYKPGTFPDRPPRHS